MSNRELEIIMSLKDEVSKKLQGIEGAIKHVVSVANEIGDLGQKFDRTGRNLVFLGATISGPFVLALRGAAQYSVPVKTEMENLSAIFKAFQIQIAGAVVPIVQQFSTVLGNLYNAFTKLSPETRTAILQGTMMVGVYGTLAGVILSLAGKMMKLVQQTAALSTMMAAISPIQKIILAIIGSLVLLIGLWDRVKVVAIPVLNTIEFTVNSIAAAFQELFSLIVGSATLIIKPFERLLYILSLIPGAQQKAFKSAAEGAKAALEEWDAVAAGWRVWADESIRANSRIVFEGVQGELAQGMDSLSRTIKEGWQAINNPGGLNLEELKATLSQMQNIAQEKFNAIRDIISGTVQAMQQGFSDFFFNALTGQLKSAQEMFADFGKAVLRILTDVFAKLLIVKALTAIAGPSGKIFGVALGDIFHEGGMVEKMHSGGHIRRAHQGMALASDEVPIIAQTGEGILSRRGMSALGGAENLNRLNKGGSMGRGDEQVQININPTLVVKAWDTSDILRHKKEIEAIIVDSIQKNQPIRNTIVRWGK